MSNTKYDRRHGGPYDRGSADAWYARGRSPHYYKGKTYASEMVARAEMTQEEIDAYNAGYDEGVAIHGPFGGKDWR